MTTEYESVLAAASRRDKEVLAAYCVGSQVYGTATPESDRDYVLVVNVREHNELVRKPKINVTVRGFEDYAKSVESGNIFFLECYFAPRAFVLKKDVWMPFPLPRHLRDSVRKRAAFSALEKSSSDFNKGIKVGDPKKVYHALRVLEFGTQLVDLNEIRDFTAAKPLYEMVMTEPRPLDEAFRETFESRYAYLRSKF